MSDKVVIVMLLQASIMLEEKDKLQSVGYKNIAISDKHVSKSGDVNLSVRLALLSLIFFSIACCSG